MRADPTATPSTPHQAGSLSRGRAIAWVVAVASLLTLLGSVSMLGLAISEYQQAAGRRQYYYNPIQDTSFSIGGLPVEIREEIDDQGRGDLVVRFAQDELRLQVQIPNPNALPLFTRHADWFRVFRWADGTGMNATEFAAARASGERPESLVIVTRALGPGAPPGSWGDVWRHQWVFTFYTFLPPAPDAPPGTGGGFAQERWEYPESPRAYDRRVQAARLRGDPAPERNPRELKEDTWQYGAAMLVMPPGSAPPHSFNRGVLIQNRWIVAVASLSMIAAMVAVAVAIAPPRVK